MSTRRTALHFISLLALLAGTPAAHAQWAVVDVGAIAQLIQEVQVLEQELATAQGELAQSQQTFRSMTGNRGMQMLLAGVARNYLPTSGGDLQSLLAGNPGAWGALGGAMQALVDQNAVLSAQQIGQLAPAATHLEAVRRTTALAQAIEAAALANSSARFGSLEQLIGAIAGASDQKAILELNARIGAEQTLTANEQTKLEVLQRAMQSQRWSDRLREREQIVALHGRFDTRFEPVP
jgi:type IV secretion system protein VirB5